MFKKFSSQNYLLICGLPFLLSTCKCKPTPTDSIAQDLVEKHLDQKSSSDLQELPSITTGFEDLDYWELELELAQEMVRLNKQKKFLEDQNELRQKLKKESANSDSSKSDNSDKSTWQATEGVVDALIRSNLDNNKSKTVKRAASKSVEQRMLSAKYNRRGGMSQGSDSSLKPRWMRLVYEMKNRKHHRSNNGKFRSTRKLL